MSAQFFVSREKCPLCGNKASMVYQQSYASEEMRQYLENFYELEKDEYGHYLEGANLIIDRCSSCQLVFQRDIPNDELMSILYEKWISDDKGFTDAVSKRPPDFFARIAQEHFALIKYFNKPVTDLHFLDFGMGWGTWCKMAQGFGISAYGSELSKARVAHSKKFGIRVIDFEDIPNHDFDVINSDQVFEHLSDPKYFLKQLVSGLKTGGICHLFVPNGFDILRRLEKPNWELPSHHPNSLNPIAPLEHINCYNHHSLTYLAESVGLREVQMPKSFPMGGEIRSSLKERLKNVIRPVKELVIPNPYPFRTTNLFFEKV